MTKPDELSRNYNGLELALLGSAALDVAPRDLHEKLNVALLAGTVAAGASAGAAAASAGVAGAAAVHATGALTQATTALSSAGVVAASGTTGTTLVVSLVAWKWVAVAVVCGTAALGVGRHFSSTSVEATSPVSQPRASIGAAVKLPTPASVPLPESTGEPALPVAPRAEVSSAPLASARQGPVVLPLPVRSTSHVVPADDLSRELALIDDARAALTAGDSARVIERLDRYELAFAAPHLAAEALALRVEGYALRHDGPRVRGLVETFVARYPEHPLVARMRTLASAP